MLSVSPTVTLIIGRTLPLMVGLFAIMLVQLVDSVFIGMLGVDELAVHGMTLPFQTVFVGLQVGIGVAATSIIARELGAKQKDKAAMMATLSVSVGLMLIAFVCLLLWLWKGAAFSAFIDDGILPSQAGQLEVLFEHYWPVWLLGSLSVAALYLMTCIYRANGDCKITGSMFVIASLVNLILDPVLMFSLDMGMAGAALATAIGYGVAFLYMLFKARGKQWFSGFGISRTTLLALKELIATTVMTTANQILPAVSAFLVMLLIAKTGTDSLAFWSLMTRFESFMIVFTLALTMSIPPLISRYLGEDKWDKISDLLFTTVKVVLILHVVMGGLLVVISPSLVPLLSPQESFQNWFGMALLLLPMSYGPLGICMVVVSAFNALGMSKRALLLTGTRLFVFYVPAVWIGVQSGDISHVVIAAAIANVLAGAMACVLVWKTLSIQSLNPVRLNNHIVAN